jgi:phospholipid/cholesterol/gamma-HCH transport system substrate-binding protein
MNRNVLETVMGAVVLVVALIFLAFAYSSAGIRTVSGYTVTAKFDHIDGIKIGSDVRISGIKVGTVTAATLDPKTFQADVRMTIDGAYPLPVDTVAVIASPSLLGDNVMMLTPGNDDKTILPGGAIAQTQSPTSLQSLMAQAMFSLSGGTKPPDGAAPPPPGPAPLSPTPGNPDPAAHKP